MDSYNDMDIKYGDTVYHNMNASRNPPEFEVIEVFYSIKENQKHVKARSKNTGEVIVDLIHNWRKNRIPKGIARGTDEEKLVDKLEGVLNIDESEVDTEALFYAANFVKFVTESDIDSVMHVASKLQDIYGLDENSVEALMKNATIEEHINQYIIKSNQGDFKISK